MTDNPASLVERYTPVTMAGALRLHAHDDCGETYVPTHLCNIAADFVDAQVEQIAKLEAERTAAIAAARDAAFEEAACAADRFAENKRANGIDGHCDPLEAVAFDEALTDFAQLLRSNKSSPDTQDSRTTKDTDHAS